MRVFLLSYLHVLCMTPVVVCLGETGWVIACVLLNPLVTRQLGVGEALGGVKVAANCVQLVHGGFHVECFRFY